MNILNTAVRAAIIASLGLAALSATASPVPATDLRAAVERQAASHHDVLAPTQASSGGVRSGRCTKGSSFRC